MEGYLKDIAQGGIAEIGPIIKGALKNLEKQPFYQSLIAGDLPKAIEQFGTFLKQFSDGALDVFKQLNQLGEGGLATNLQKSISGAMAAIGVFLKPILKSIFGDLFENLGKFLGQVGEIDVNKLIKNFEDFLTTTNKLADSIIDVIEGMKGWTVAIYQFFVDVYNKAVEWSKPVLDFLKDIFDKIVAWLKPVFDQITEWFNSPEVKEGLGKFGEYISSMLPTLREWAVNIGAVLAILVGGAGLIATIGLLTTAFAGPIAVLVGAGGLIALVGYLDRGIFPTTGQKLKKQRRH